jgi:hypothetical protein
MLEQRLMLTSDALNVFAELQGHLDGPSSVAQIPFQLHADDFLTARGSTVITFRTSAVEGS